MSTETASIATGLVTAVSDTYILALKIHAAHWNVTGPNFNGLHLAFEAQYQALIEGADILAERLRALGKAAPFGAKALLNEATIDEAIHATDGQSLARTIAKDHRAVAKFCKELSEAADEAGDGATSDLLVARIEEHEKFAWMLEATAA
jgi:starvation-inducible DNA-binding protein